jgi:hypothetical protein
MPGLKIHWKKGNREFLFELSKVAIIAILIALGGVKSVSDLVPKRLSDQLWKVIQPQETD